MLCKPPKSRMPSLCDDELSLIFTHITLPAHRSSISQVCKQWHRLEGITRLSLHALEPYLISKFLPRFPNLIKFESSTHITDTQLEFVAKTCPRIENLNLNLKSMNRGGDEMDDDLGVDDVGDVGLSAISKGCLRLARVSLRGRTRVGDSGVVGMVRALRELVWLDLGGCVGVTDESLRVIGEVGSVRILNLRGCSMITDEGLKGLVSGGLCDRLEKLVIAECDRITDNGVCLLQRLRCLKDLNLADCGPRITDVGGVAIAKIKTLERLNLAWLINIMDITLIEVARNCENLLRIVITGCEDISGSGIRVFAEHKSLESLVMESCSNVFVDDIRHLVYGCPSLRHLVLDRRFRAWMPLELRQYIRVFCWLGWGM